MSVKPVQFVEYVGFLKAALEFGINTEDGLKELIDNSVDAEATHVDVIIQKMPMENALAGKNSPNMLRLIVADNGRGIPQFITDEDEELRPGLAYAMSFGGRERDVYLEGKQRTIGRFGWGLSATVSCLAREEGRAIVWTKQKEDDAWRYCEWKYDDILANNCTLVEATDKAPPLLPPDFTTGTIVMIDMVNSDRKRLGPLQDILLSHSARTYRHRMANDGLTIRVSSIPEGGWHNAKHKVAHMRDPMCRLDGSMEVEFFGKAKLYDRITLKFDGREDNEYDLHEFGERLIDKGKPTERIAEIHIDVSLLEKSKVDLALSANLNAPLSAPDRDRILREWNIGQRGQGFSFIRDGREIVHSRSKGLYTKQAFFNYMHGEIHFPCELDHLFGIQQNKSRFGIDGNLGKIIQEIIGNILTKVRHDVDSEAKKSVQLKASVGATQVEEEIKKAAPRLDVPMYSPRQVEIGKASRQSAKQATERQLEITHNAMLKIIADQAVTDNKSEQWKKEQEASLKVQLDQLLHENDQRWKDRAPVRFQFRALSDATSSALYDVETRGDEAFVYLQQGTPLIDALQKETLANDDELQQNFQMIIGALAYAEHLDCTVNPDEAQMWSDIREDITQHASAFLELYRPFLDEEEVVE